MCFSADGARSCQIVTPPTTQVRLGDKCPALIFPNMEGAGYYRFTGAPSDRAKLIAAATTLDAADQYTLFRNADAAMRGGYGSAADYFAPLHTLAPVAQWDLIEAADNSLHNLRITGIIAPGDVGKIQAFVRGNFGPRLAPLGLAAKPGEAPVNALTRQYLVQLLLEEGHDPALTAQLAKAGHTYLSSGGKDLGGIAPELRIEAMRAGVMAEGAPFADSVMDAMRASDDEYFTQSAIYALTGANDDATLKKLLDMTLTPAIRIGDVRYVFRYMLAEQKGRDVAWAWFKTNYSNVLKRLSSYGMGDMPDILQYACDGNAKADLAAFFGPRTSQLTGTLRRLKENEDRIDRCVAFKQAKGAEISRAISALK